VILIEWEAELQNEKSESYLLNPFKVRMVFDMSNFGVSVQNHYFWLRSVRSNVVRQVRTRVLALGRLMVRGKKYSGGATDEEDLEEG
jgi:hypothetical protein